MIVAGIGRRCVAGSCRARLIDTDCDMDNSGPVCWTWANMHCSSYFLADDD